MLRLIVGALWVLATVSILIVTLGAIPQRLVGFERTLGVLSPRSWFDPTTWSVGSPVEFALNMALFVPWGMLAVFVLGARRWWLAALLGVALTVSIEVLQIPSARISDPRDLVANSLGALLGIALACIALAPLRVRARQA